MEGFHFDTVERSDLLSKLHRKRYLRGSFHLERIHCDKTCEDSLDDLDTTLCQQRIFFGFGDEKSTANDVGGSCRKPYQSRLNGKALNEYVLFLHFRNNIQLNKSYNYIATA